MHVHRPTAWRPVASVVLDERLQRRGEQRLARHQRGDLCLVEADQGAIVAAVPDPQEGQCPLVLVRCPFPQVGVGDGLDGYRVWTAAQEQVEAVARAPRIAGDVVDRCLDVMRARGERAGCAGGRCRTDRAAGRDVGRVHEHTQRREVDAGAVVGVRHRDLRCGNVHEDRQAGGRDPDCWRYLVGGRALHDQDKLRTLSRRALSRRVLGEAILVLVGLLEQPPEIRCRAGQEGAHVRGDVEVDPAGEAAGVEQDGRRGGLKLTSAPLRTAVGRAVGGIAVDAAVPGGPGLGPVGGDPVGVDRAAVRAPVVAVVLYEKAQSGRDQCPRTHVLHDVSLVETGQGPIVAALLDPQDRIRALVLIRAAAPEERIGGRGKRGGLPGGRGRQRKHGDESGQAGAALLHALFSRPGFDGDPIQQIVISLRKADGEGGRILYFGDTLSRSPLKRAATRDRELVLPLLACLALGAAAGVPGGLGSSRAPIYGVAPSIRSPGRPGARKPSLVRVASRSPFLLLDRRVCLARGSSPRPGSRVRPGSRGRIEQVLRGHQGGPGRSAGCGRS